MTSRRRRVDESKRWKDLTGVALFTAVAIVIIAFGMVAFHFAPVETDAMNCPEDGPSSFTVALVDVTDTLSPVQTQALRNGFQLIRDYIVPPFGSLELFVVEEDGSKLLTRRAALCRPDRSGSELTRNKKRQEEAWHERYQKPFDAALDAAAGGNSSSRSPILEAIQSIAVTSLQAPTRAQKRQVLVVFSDFMQNTKQVSFYKGVPNSGAFLASNDFMQLKADLSGVSVLLVQIERPSAKDDNSLMLLWKQIIQAEGAATVCIASLQGFRMDSAIDCVGSEGEGH